MIYLYCISSLIIVLNIGLMGICFQRADRNPDSNTLKYTPGTEFMAKLQLAVFSWAAQRASSDLNKGIKFFVSGADREGEGEFKIYQHLMDIEVIQDFGNIATVDKAKVPGPKDSVLLVGTCVTAGDSTIEPWYTGLMFHLFCIAIPI